MSQNFSPHAFEQAVEVEAQRCLLIGTAPPCSSNTSRHLVRLLFMLRATGARAHVASVGPSPLLGGVLKFASGTDLSRSASEIAHFSGERIFLYPSALNFGDCKGGNWLNRRLQELRRLRFAFHVGRTAQRTTLICDPISYRFRTQAGVVIATMLGALSKRRRATVKLRTDRLGKVAPDIVDPSVTAPDLMAAEREFYAQCKRVTGPSHEARLTPSIAQQALHLARHSSNNPESAEFFDELALMTVAVRDHSCEHLPIVRLLRRQALQSIAGFSGPPVSRAYQLANRISPEGSQYALPITQFMKHLRMALRLEKDYPLSTRNDASSFLMWYRDKGPAKSCGGVLPEPLPALTPPPEEETRLGHCADWGQFGRIADLDSRPFPVPPSFLIARDCLPGGRFDLETADGRIAWAFEQVLSRAGDASLLDAIGPATLEWLATPIAGGSGNASRFEYMMALHCRRSLHGGQDFLMPWLKDATHDWFRSFVISRASELSRFSSKDKPILAPEHQLDIVGLGQQSTGIAVNFRMSQQAIYDAGLPNTVRDAESGYAQIAQSVAKAPIVLRRSAAVFHLNADRIPQALVAPTFAARADSYNIGYLLWEFAQLPEAHSLAIEMLDEIWVPTRFLRAAYGNATDKPVTLVGKGLHLPEVATQAMRTFGLKEAGLTFLTCFDFHSSVERKNPLAAVRAFQAAFPSHREDVQMVVKTTPKLDGHWGDPEDQIGQIRKLARADRRIKILSKYLEWEQFLSLIRSVDCLISPHRAEGFGYIPAYALYYGVPVVNTDFSGVRDYCTSKTSFPVAYELCDVPSGHAIYPVENAKWANVNVDALAATLCQVAQDPIAARARAAAGQALMHSYYSVPALRERYVRRFSEIGLLEETDLKFCSRNVHAQE